VCESVRPLSAGAACGQLQNGRVGGALATLGYETAITR
jgi:hypothetical protein